MSKLFRGKKIIKFPYREAVKISFSNDLETTPEGKIYLMQNSGGGVYFKWTFFPAFFILNCRPLNQKLHSNGITTT